MATRVQKVKVIVFVAAALALLLTIVAIFTGVELFQHRHRYVVQFPGSVDGLQEGAEVTIRGVRVGTVEDLYIDPNSYELVTARLVVDADAIIKTDAHAILRYKGVTGLKRIEIQGGSQQAPVLPPGHRIPSSQAGLVALLEGQSLEDVEQIIANVAELTGPATRERVNRLLDSSVNVIEELQRTSEELAQMTAETRQQLHDSLQKTTTAIESLSADTSALVEDARTALARMELVETMEEARSAMASLRATAQDVQRTVGMNRQQLAGILTNLRTAARNLEEFSRMLRNEPRQLFFGQPPEERELP